ncbi:MAG: magnesium and cobalt transport protein CorA [Cytophagales bacterium]|nr:MAG: magnesium and cobalt transport protein CorA [Cytophagales bacterium]
MKNYKHEHKIMNENTAKLSLLAYNPVSFVETVVQDIRDCTQLRQEHEVMWINLDGVKDSKQVKKVGMYFDLHPLLIEDICNTNIRPKIEFYQDHIFVSLKMLSYQREEKNLFIEQVSLILGNNYILSFQEDIEGDVFEPIREKIRKQHNGKVRNSNAAYLFYSMLDAIVDGYTITLEDINEGLEKLEEEIIEKEAERNPTKELYEFRKKLKSVYKHINPVREISSVLLRTENDTMKSVQQLQKVHIYLQDVNDHTLQVIENAEAYIDATANLLDLYLSILSNKTNDVMKFLTIFSSIFLPLTFIAGVYGMNFEKMPELHFEYGYYAVWGLMLAIALGTYWYFKNKRLF